MKVIAGGHVYLVLCLGGNSQYVLLPQINKRTAFVLVVFFQTKVFVSKAFQLTRHNDVNLGDPSGHLDSKGKPYVIVESLRI